MLEVYAFKCFMGWKNISHTQFSERRLNLTCIANHYIRLGSCLKGTTLLHVCCNDKVSVRAKIRECSINLMSLANHYFRFYSCLRGFLLPLAGFFTTVMESDTLVFK